MSPHKLNRNRKYWLVTAFVFLVFPAFSYNLIGSELSYQSLGGKNYFLSAKLFRNCNSKPICASCVGSNNLDTCKIPIRVAGGLLPSGVNHQLASQTCGNTLFSTVLLSAGPNVVSLDVIQLCATERSICHNCNSRTVGNFTPGVEIYTFTGTVNLSSIPSSCCWVSFVTGPFAGRDSSNSNLQNPGGIAFYNHTDVNVCVEPSNSSPVFTNDLNFVTCAGQPYSGSLGAIDPDGDSLSYRLGEAKIGPNTNAAYVPPLNSIFPFPVSGGPVPGPFPPLPPQGIFFETLGNGVIRFTPQSAFSAYLVIEVLEWRRINGVVTLVGLSRHDAQFTSKICQPPNDPPIVRIYKEDGTLNIPQPHFNFSMAAEQAYCLILSAWDRTAAWDTTDFRFTQAPQGKEELNPIYLTGGNFTKLYNNNNRSTLGPKFDSVKFCWTPPDSLARSMPYYLVVNAFDRACPIKSRKTVAFAFVVRPKILAQLLISKQSRIVYNFAFQTNQAQIINPSKTFYLIEKTPQSNVFDRYDSVAVNQHHFDSLGWHKVRLNLSYANVPGYQNSNQTRVIEDSVFIAPNLDSAALPMIQAQIINNKQSRNVYNFAYQTTQAQFINPSKTIYLIEKSPQSNVFDRYDSMVVNQHRFDSIGWHKVRLNLSYAKVPGYQNSDQTTVIEDSVYIIPPLKVNVKNAEICVGSTLNLQVSGSGGEPIGQAYRYTFFEGDLQSTKVIRAASLDSNLVVQAGTTNTLSKYKVLIQDAAGNSDSSIFTVFTRALPSKELPPLKNICEGGYDTLDAGNSHWSVSRWRWLRAPSALSKLDSLTQILKIKKSGLYVVQKTDSFGCSVLDTCQVFNIQPSALFAVTPTFACVDPRRAIVFETRSKVLNTNPVGTKYNWFLNTNNYQVLPLNETREAQDTLVLKFSQWGKYYIHLLAINGKCRDTIVQQVNALPAPVADFVSHPDNISIHQPIINLNNQSSIADGSKLSFVWILPSLDTISPIRQTSEESPQSIALKEDTICQKIRLIAISEGNCRDTFSRDYCLTGDYTLFIPNAFRPRNEDGSGGGNDNCLLGCNTTFKVSANYFKQIEIMVLNRRGDLVYQFSGDEKAFEQHSGWNGRDLNLNKDCQQGAYVYRITLTNMRGKQYDYRGLVNLIR